MVLVVGFITVVDRPSRDYRHYFYNSNSGGGVEMTDTYRVTADELRSFIERIERIELDRKDLAEDVKEIFSEAKGRGYDTAVMRKLIAMRKKSPDDLAEEQAVLEMYAEALGMG